MEADSTLSLTLPGTRIRNGQQIVATGWVQYYLGFSWGIRQVIDLHSARGVAFTCLKREKYFKDWRY
jgi:hypothetical protein